MWRGESDFSNDRNDDGVRLERIENYFIGFYSLNPDALKSFAILWSNHLLRPHSRTLKQLCRFQLAKQFVNYHILLLRPLYENFRRLVPARK